MSMSIIYRSDTFASDRYVIDDDPRVFAFWDIINSKLWHMPTFMTQPFFSWETWFLMGFYGVMIISTRCCLFFCMFRAIYCMFHVFYNIANIEHRLYLWKRTVYTNHRLILSHYNDLIMRTMASQIISLTIVYSTVYSGADQRKHQSSASLACVWGFQRWPRTKGQQRGKCFDLMTSSCVSRERILWGSSQYNDVILPV